MEWLEASTENCPVQRTLDVVGEKWTLLILRDAVNGVRRFDDFHRHIGLSEAVLSDRLRKLIAAGVMRTVPYREPGSRSRNEYRLTRKGWDLWPVLMALSQWGEAYALGSEGPVLDVRHTACGSPVRVVVECSAEHSALTLSEVTARPGPGARPRT
ncbi:winged helix-turn-helix transcriptional regulator [Streptomyces sp. NBC_01451]|uniref:winged helix-turn-helix transcriptional regulator n=1 Tax=Streptomyces sp. NBC_01451 TaxID=2903872 RepID=UPI002E2ED9BF|nr:helix-turn-helix domain-containing protein [Streptomyces sp. NBC_01451]